MLNLTPLLKQLYEHPKKVNDEINKIIKPLESKVSWSEKDIMLIAYPDSIKSKVPLKKLKSLLDQIKHVSTIHILPFHPYTSDKGFSVQNFKNINKDFGSWDDIKKLSQHYKICADLVLNHVSQEHMWFKNFLKNKNPGKNYFIQTEDYDLTKVFRPRTSPLQKSVKTINGTKNVWTTFSQDQIDLNFKNPQVLLEMIKILQNYLQKGISVIRLDAIAYAWKKNNTNCANLKEVHVLVKIFRKIIDYVKPGSLLLTETNFPHEENISYLKKDEAHIIYQFPWPPYLLYSMLQEDVEFLVDWLNEGYTKKGLYLNFTSSHDGMGVLPLVRKNKGLDYSKYIMSMGGKNPYEINNTYFQALTQNDGLDEERFLLTQLLTLSIKGIPAIYLNSLFAEKDNEQGYLKSKQKRDLNRKQFSSKEIKQKLSSNITQKYLQAIKIRVTQKAFHPNASQRTTLLKNNLIQVQREFE